MIPRRVVVLSSFVATAASFFTLGVLHSRGADASVRASYQAELDALRAEKIALAQRSLAVPAVPAGTAGLGPSFDSPALQAKMIAEIKEQLEAEMGLVPLNLIRERRASFVELYATDSFDRTNYGTAGYLGQGYFITVKHAVVALNDDDGRASARKITSIKVMYQGEEVPAKLVDAGDADVEVHSGDWAIIRTRALDLPPLRVDTGYPYDFADPIFRLGNDYSKGVILSTGYVGQRTPNGLVTALTDGHPGVSGGGVLDRRGNFVGIPIGRMQGDYRFSFILPIRPEMLRKVPRSIAAAAISAPADMP
ncbi:MAG: trypsin-like peptidase domain-containing protein [Acidobacteria bacterium]|nr:trypsin-like peptidase domain-containing protein [Acidobacteriota bacterium]